MWLPAAPHIHFCIANDRLFLLLAGILKLPNYTHIYPSRRSLTTCRRGWNMLVPKLHFCWYHLSSIKSMMCFFDNLRYIDGAQCHSLKMMNSSCITSTEDKTATKNHKANSQQRVEPLRVSKDWQRTCISIFLSGLGLCIILLVGLPMH